MNAVRWTGFLSCGLLLLAGCAGVPVNKAEAAPQAAPEIALPDAAPLAPEIGGFAVRAPQVAQAEFALPLPEPPQAVSVSADRPAAPGRGPAELPLPEPPRATRVAAAAQPPAVPVSSAPAAAPQRAAAAPQQPRASAPPAVPAPAAPPAAPVERHQAYARRGDDVQVALEGTGWVFTGTSDPAVAGYLSRTVERSSTVFSFRTASAGTAVLSFERQDGKGGSGPGARVELSVISPQEFAARVERGESSPEIPPPRRGIIEALIEARLYDDALRELERLGDTDPAYRNDRTAAVHMARGDLRAARSYWARNAPQSEAVEPDEMQARALSGLLRIAVMLDDYPGVLSALEPLRRGQLPAADVEARTLEAGAYLLLKSNGAAAIEVLEGLAMQTQLMRRGDEVYMLLAQAYESEGPQRDARRAERLYRRVFESYPESSLAETARQRARYLERHILLVR